MDGCNRKYSRQMLPRDPVEDLVLQFSWVLYLNPGLCGTVRDDPESCIFEKKTQS